MRLHDRTSVIMRQVLLERDITTAIIAINYRDALKDGPHVRLIIGEKLRYFYLQQAGERNLSSSYSRNLGSTF